MNMKERIGAISNLAVLVEWFEAEDGHSGEDSFLNMETDSPCGMDCCIVLDEFAVLIERYPDIAEELRDAVRKLVCVYFYG